MTVAKGAASPLERPQPVFELLESGGGLPVTTVAAVLVAHAVLGLLMFRFTAAATAHSLLAVGAGIALALTGAPVAALQAAAYVVGSEVLWRMTGAGVFYELGKYGVIVILTIALFRQRSVRWVWLPVLYFALLLPSIAVVPYTIFSRAGREALAFHLAGPLALAVAVFFCSQVQLSAAQWVRVVVSLIAPLVATVSVAVGHMGAATELSFTTESNLVTSGGFGPNQVSLTVGLGAWLATLAAVLFRPSRMQMVLLLALGVLFATHSALTFSRGGLYGAAGAMLIAAFYLLRDNRARMTLLVGAVLVFVIANYFVWPQLENLTQGMIAQRFESTDPTGRVELMQRDLSLWWDHFFLGTGPGGAEYSREVRSLPHTEFTRALGEHGLLGLLALVILAVMGIQAVARAPTTRHKALAAACVVWGLISMVHAAMRTVSPAFIFGLGFAASAPPVPRSRAAARPLGRGGHRWP